MTLNDQHDTALRQSNIVIQETLTRYPALMAHDVLFNFLTRERQNRSQVVTNDPNITEAMLVVLISGGFSLLSSHVDR